LAVAERQGNGATPKPGSPTVECSGDEGREVGHDLVALAPPEQIGLMLSAEGANRFDGPKTVPKRRKAKSKRR
jgi:hypothetical protein